jgi:hypothetical protein
LGLSKADPLDDGSGLDEPWVTEKNVYVAPIEGSSWYWLEQVWDWIFAVPGETWDASKGSYLWWHLSRDKPIEQGAFPVVTSVGGWKKVTEWSGYHRIWLAPSFWYYASQGVVANAIDIPFPTAVNDWGELTHWALFDAWTMTMFGELSPHKTILEGQKPSFWIGQLEIFLS